MSFCQHALFPEVYHKLSWSDVFIDLEKAIGGVAAARLWYVQSIPCIYTACTDQPVGLVLREATASIQKDSRQNAICLMCITARFTPVTRVHKASAVVSTLAVAHFVQFVPRPETFLAAGALRLHAAEILAGLGDVAVYFSTRPCT